MLLFFLSLAQADPEGLICQFSDPFSTLRYRFKSELLTIETLNFETYLTTRTHQNASLEIDRTTLDVPKYIITNKDTNETIFVAIRNQKGTDGMSEEVYLYEAKYKTITGGCDNLTEVGTHEIFATKTKKSPDLILYKTLEIKGSSIGNLREGVEVKILETTESGYKVKILSGYEEGKTGWITKESIRTITPSLKTP